jgi:hypothetical protein
LKGDTAVLEPRTWKLGEFNGLVVLRSEGDVAAQGKFSFRDPTNLSRNARVVKFLGRSCANGGLGGEYDICVFGEEYSSLYGYVFNVRGVWQKVVDLGVW